MMIIKSDFRDYYDHVPHLYGGGDPKNVYVRKKLRGDDNDRYCTISIVLGKERRLGLFTPYGGYEYKLLVICGKVYVIYRPDSSRPDYIFNDRYRIMSNNFIDKQIELYKEKHRDPWSFKKHNKTENWYNRANGVDGGEMVLAISRKIKTPVFTMDWGLSGIDWEVDVNIPKLSEMGVPQLIPPEQLYQDISYYVGNTLNENPDIAPPVTVANKDRIVQHGFDPVVSFRHRK